MLSSPISIAPYAILPLSPPLQLCKTLGRMSGSDNCSCVIVCLNQVGQLRVEAERGLSKHSVVILALIKPFALNTVFLNWASSRPCCFTNIAVHRQRYNYSTELSFLDPVPYVSRDFDRVQRSSLAPIVYPLGIGDCNRQVSLSGHPFV